MKELPGPRGLPLVGTIHPFLGEDFLAPLLRLFERYGPLFRLRLPLGMRLVVLAHPEAVERVLRTRRDNYVKGSVYDGARILLGDGLVTSEGPLWQRQRNLARPAFTTPALQGYLEAMAESTGEALDRWASREPGAPLDAQGEMSRLTMDITGRTLFGMDISDQSGHASAAFTAALKAIGKRGPSDLQLPLWVPTPGNLRFRGTLRELDALVYAIIERFHTLPAEQVEHTLLGAYMGSRDPETGEAMSDRQLRDEVITLYLAGHETTASLLAWSLYCLSRNPQASARVVAEIDATLGGEVPDLAQLKALRYTEQFIDEVLRLYPPAWTIARNAMEADEVMGYGVPRGSMVMLPIYMTHRMRAFWPDPEVFDPERFSPSAAKDRHPFAWLPFSLGPRMCIGMHFALYEAKMVLGLLLRRFSVRLAVDQDIGCRAQGTLRPARPIRVFLTPR